MRHEHSAGAVLYTLRGTIPYYVVVVERAGHCGLPKGHLEAGETEQEAALREIWEETGIQATILSGARYSDEYRMANGTVKHITYFIASFSAQTPSNVLSEVREVKLLPYEEARDSLTHKSTKRILSQANEWITEHQR
ncbi:MAG TPA: NUDIX domain-containing protein [Candidatus Aphodoplasma excrementigallinarum]|uniref:Bis(5'-nucleosyl)-tetraphosphatase [asymmetrical] n=1 Tax=Candidatus Aphodoplasma excrementigallinarum TaxID=2840673 RepID=A0A9D1NHP9_9FIRM|nr:NUDIX domain-containing protein [Candidatus Aphodoplasma excrementigallinarum]